MKFNKILASAVFGLLISIAGAGVANAQVIAPTPSACLIINTSLGYGSSDFYTGGAVTQLQQFLTNQGYFSSIYLGTGRFGAITARAVAQYQAAHGISPIGVVGPITRAAIYNQTCGGIITPPPVSGAPSIYFVSPTSGPVGTQVSVTGFGFTNDNTILLDGMAAVRDVPVSSSIAVACTTDPSCRGGIRQTITFTLPSSIGPNCASNMICPMYLRLLTAGNYQLTVQNSNGTSNAQTFTVTDGTTNIQPLSISGLDAPPTLALGTTGTWTVHTVAGSGVGTLHYSVVWGDESFANPMIMAPTSASTQTSTTFTHAYQRAGLYTPLFTVTDDAGHTASVSSTVTITPLY